MLISGKRLEKCSTCTRDFSLSCSSAASWAMVAWDSMAIRSGLVEQGMQVAVLAVVDLARAFVDLQRDADVAPGEEGLEMRAHLGQQVVAGLFLHGLGAPRGHADM